MIFGAELLGLNPCSLSGKIESEAQRENAILFEELFNRFSNIAVSRLNWTGLPESVNERFLNQTLYLFGRCAFFDDPEFGYLTLPCTMAGGFNMYYNPVSVNAYSFNYNKMLSPGEFVYIRANPSAVPLAFSVFEYTRRMSDVLRSIDVLTKKMKHPYWIMCDEKERLTYQNIIKKIVDNEVMVLGSKGFDIRGGMEQIKVIDTASKAELQTLWDSYKQLESILYTALGIESVPHEKRERLLVDEVNSNNMVTEMNVEVMVKELKEACRQINKKYGLNIDVEAKRLYEYREGDESVGEVYNRTENAD